MLCHWTLQFVKQKVSAIVLIAETLSIAHIVQIPLQIALA